MADVPQEVLEELNDALEKEAQQYNRMLEDRVKALYKCIKCIEHENTLYLDKLEEITKEHNIF